MSKKLAHSASTCMNVNRYYKYSLNKSPMCDVKNGTSWNIIKDDSSLKKNFFLMPECLILAFTCMHCSWCLRLCKDRLLHLLAHHRWFKATCKILINNKTVITCLLDCSNCSTCQYCLSNIFS